MRLITLGTGNMESRGDVFKDFIVPLLVSDVRTDGIYCGVVCMVCVEV